MKLKEVTKNEQIIIGDLVWIKKHRYPLFDESNPNTEPLEGPYPVLQKRQTSDFTSDLVVYLNTDSGKEAMAYADWFYVLEDPSEKNKNK